MLEVQGLEQNYAQEGPISALLWVQTDAEEVLCYGTANGYVAVWKFEVILSVSVQTVRADPLVGLGH